MPQKMDGIKMFFMPHILDGNEVGFYEGFLQERNTIDRSRILDGVADDEKSRKLDGDE